AALAFVGGSVVDRGGHSAVEPALAAIPILFGPHTRNLASLAEELKREGGAREVRSEETLYREALRVLTDPQVAQEMGRKARTVIQRNQGAVARTLNVVFAHFPQGGA
ncbi:MAG: 3-deoxy-D-manno-octulosonic acid transferase, partial [Deltaproteobacteria bacterium]|nr:3-deoxy-D-manno-octulosonic acid transferase [Deltaproteobacteria bacterium]